MYFICSFHNVNYRELVNEQELTSGKYLLNSVDYVLSYQPYDLQSGCSDVSSHCDVSTCEGMADAVALHNQAMRPDAHNHIFFLPRYSSVNGVGCCAKKGRRMRATVMTVWTVRQKSVKRSRGRFLK